MKRLFLIFGLTLVALMLCSQAVADGPTNPRRAYVEEHIRLASQKHEQKNILRFLSGSTSVSIQCKNNIVILTPTTFSITINNGGSTAWELEYAIQDTVWDPEGCIYYSQKTTNTALKNFTFYTAGTYRLFVYLYRPGATEADSIWTRDFTVQGDGTHPTLEQKMQEIYNDRKVAGNTWETVLNLHDWLTHNMYYDHNHEYYGAEAVFRGKGVCDSYSKAFKMLCDLAGVDGNRVISQKQNHAWNAIKLDGKWYQVDVTWDDGDSQERTQPVSGEESYDYFCVNDDIMFLDHISSDATFKPGCTSLDANYYIKKNLWEPYTVYASSGETVQEFFSRQINGGITNPYLATNKQDGWQYYWQGSSGTGMQEYQYIICAYGLNKQSWTIEDGGAIKVEVRYIREDKAVEARVTGWSLTETGTLNLPGGLKKLESNALAGTCSTTVIIPEGCTEIEGGAFAGSGVRTVYVPSTLKTFGDGIFTNCGRILFILSSVNDEAYEYAQANDILMVEP